MLATLALVAITAVWGWTFVLVKEAIQTIPPYEFLAIRFIAAALLLALFIPREVVAARKPELRAGASAGVVLGVGYGLQTVGLQYTSATKAGFITGLFVVFTPPLAALMLRRVPPFSGFLAAGISAGGLLLLTQGRLGSGFNYGDLLVLGCAVSFAVHVVILGKIAKAHHAGMLAVLQLGSSGVGFALVSVMTEDLVAPAGTQVFVALGVTAVLASALAYLVQTWAQKHLSPTRTAVTLAMEPVFAGGAGFILLGERLTGGGWLGAGLILGAMLMASRIQDLDSLSDGILGPLASRGG